MAKKKILAVFYSRSGYTKKVIEALSKATGCAVEELVDNEKRRGIFGFIKSGREATQKKLVKLNPLRYNPADYDLVVIGTPVWASTMASAVRTFIVENKGKLKNVAFITTSGGSDTKTFDALEELSGKKPVATCNFIRKELSGEALKRKIDNFVSKL